MDYPEFNSISIISLMVALVSLILVMFFIKKITTRIENIEKKLGEIIKSFNNLFTDVSRKYRSKNNKDSIEYMEGDIDLVKEGKKATFKAIYYPKKIKKK